jgi:threonylcarbamoyladenosine tRNA methylthiotransferase MtaB
MRVGFHTFGCKLNQFETEALASPLASQGFSVVSAREEADLYVINTCTVTSKADHKARALIRSLAREHPRALLVVTGCSAQLEADTLTGLVPNLLVVPQSDKPVLLDLPRFLEDGRHRAGSRVPARVDRFAFQVSQPTFHTRAFLKIQDGCDCRCAYCRVPLARGPSASLALGEVLRRARELEGHGSREIVITGVNISAWQSDGLKLSGLLQRLLSGTSSARLRLSSLEPEAVTEELVAVLRDLRICPHFHLPVQSGSDAVLERMKRRYRAGRVAEAVALLRQARPEPFVAADVIVGFPGETDTDFEQTRTLVEGIGFSALHVFPFSPRGGTAAAAMKPRVPERVRDERARALGGLSTGLAERYARSWVGREVEVLLERRSGSTAAGTSENYLKVRVGGLPPGDFRGRIARTRLIAAGKTCTGSFTTFVA